jgi:hypothetical protein
MKSGIKINMGACKFTARVRSKQGELFFDLNKMDKNQYREFHKQLVRAWKESREC